MLEEEPADVASKLAAAYGVKKVEFQKLLSELLAIINSPKYDLELLHKLLDCHEQSREVALTKLAKRALKNLGDGNFFLNEIVGLSEIGFVARLRRIYSIESDCVFSSQASFISRNVTANKFGIRIGRLTNLYRFRLAQLFANQFSRIGLPDEITSLNEVAVQAAISNLRWSNV